MYFWTTRRNSVFCNVILLTSIMVLGTVTAAQSEFRLCNKTESEVGVAIGYHNQELNDLSTEGWWNISQDSCEILIPNQLTSELYYLYAIDHENGGEWSGENYMCTQEKKFIINGNSNCFVRGYERTGFLEINTEQQTSWTVNLTEPTN